MTKEDRDIQRKLKVLRHAEKTEAPGDRTDRARGRHRHWPSPAYGPKGPLPFLKRDLCLPFCPAPWRF